MLYEVITLDKEKMKLLVDQGLPSDAYTFSLEHDGFLKLAISIFLKRKKTMDKLLSNVITSYSIHYTKLYDFSPMDSQYLS